MARAHSIASARPAVTSPWKAAPGINAAAWKRNTHKQLRAGCWPVRCRHFPPPIETISSNETLFLRAAAAKTRAARLARTSLIAPSSPESDPVVSDAVVRLVERRAAVIEDDVARLRFVRRSMAAHAAAAGRRARFLRRCLAAHRASRRRVGRALRVAATTLLLAFTLGTRARQATSYRPLPLGI